MLQSMRLQKVRHNLVTEQPEVFLYLSICLYPSVFIYHIFFIHSSIYRHLGCFHILDIINTASVNMWVCVSFQIGVFIFFRLYSGVELLDGSYGSSIFSFMRNFHNIHTVAAEIYIPTNIVQCLPFLHILSSICYLWSF